MAVNIATPKQNFRSTDQVTFCIVFTFAFQALQKRVSNLIVDLWNLSHQFGARNQEAAESLELFLNSRYRGKTLYKQSDGNSFAAEDQVRAVETINSTFDAQEEIVKKFRKSEASFAALNSLASADGVPDLLRLRVLELSQVVPLIRKQFEEDIRWRKESAKEASLASDDESVALVVLWRNSLLLYTNLFDRLSALVV